MQTQKSLVSENPKEWEEKRLAVVWERLRFSWRSGLWVAGLILLTALPRLTALNQYLIVDEADRWRWAEDFVYALSRADWAGTLVGDGYPGIVPVWAESLWIFLEAARRSLIEGQWIGESGLYLIFHEWDRSAFLYQQRLPIVLLNTFLALVAVWAVWRLFGRRVALLAGILIALDPFYLSDSRVNRAEAVITGLITLSLLALVFYHRQPRWRYVVISGILGGLSFLTKIQALAILPAIALIGLFIYVSRASEKGKPYSPLRVPTAYSLLKFGLIWAAAAGLTWFIFWPAMWVSPWQTLALVYDYATRKVGAEGVNLFFMGQTYADADPGPIFYPFTWLMRITPLALLGCILYAARLLSYLLRLFSKRMEPKFLAAQSGSLQASLIVVIYILVYTLAMTLGSHKQDRYLMPIFLGVDILAAIGLVYLWDWVVKQGLVKLKIGANAEEITPTSYSLPPTPFLDYAFLAVLLVIQLATIVPHHPYYYSYFNPLMGDGPMAVRTMRIGWGEGMDQVGAYLAAKPDSQNLAVASRFTHNMLGFKGDQISLLPDGRWTQADYIVLYIQQVQRRQEPSPGFIDYFQARPAEKVITIGGIDYAWVYPIPFTIPANPEVSVIPNQAALVGYRWERSGQIRLFWENQGLKADHQLVVRLLGHAAKTDWTACQPDSAFITQAQTNGAYVESLCAPAVSGLPASTYNVEVGLASTLRDVKREPTSFTFPEGWQAATITSAGQVVDTPEKERLETIAVEAIPVNALRLDRVYADQIRLAAYQLDPPSPQPGQMLHLTLYWQRLKEVTEPVHLTVQLADSRKLPLGRFDAGLTPARWLLGQVITTTYSPQLSPDLSAPLAAQIEVTLQNQADEVPLRPATEAGEPLDAVAARFTVAPLAWPVLDQAKPVEAVWQNKITLRGYLTSPPTIKAGQSVSVRLFWQAGQSVAENYVVFIHLLDDGGQIKAQNDDLPRAGAYPTPWWQPGQIVEDSHTLVLPPDLPQGAYQLVVGLYQPDNGTRLLLENGGDTFKLEQIGVQ